MIRGRQRPRLSAGGHQLTIGAGAQALDTRIFTCACREQDDGHRLDSRVRANGRQELEPSPSRHLCEYSGESVSGKVHATTEHLDSITTYHDIRQDHVVLPLLQHLPPHLPIVCLFHIAILVKNAGYKESQIGIVIDQQYASSVVKVQWHAR